MEKSDLTRRICDEAHKLGFSIARCCEAVESPGNQRLDEWLRRGFAGEMHYIPDRREAYRHPSGVMNGVRSLVMLAMDYSNEVPIEASAGKGRISRYAWGERDYHDVIHERLKQLKNTISDLAPESNNRGVIDTAPLMERDFARIAGLGWIGKHTLLINRERGSWFFLAALLTDLELEYDDAFEADHCGTCTACLDACPTDAFPEPYVLDATKCISYLTIELRAMPPAELRSGIGDWLFGCDVCQDVCPWNKSPIRSTEAAFEPKTSNNPAELIELFSLNEETFRQRFRKTPLWRSRRSGILRNAAIVLGNQRFAAAEQVLIGAIADEDPLVRQAVAWALKQYSTLATVKAIDARRLVETHPDVLKELELD